MKKIVLFCLLIQYCFCCFSSESETRGEIIVITNRLGDPLKESCDKLQNYVDQKLELKVYRFHKGDSLFCVKKNGFNELEKWLSDSGDWILFVHGDGKSFKDAAVRGLKIQHIYDVNVIVFAWPSKMTNGTGIKNVKNSKKNIETGINSFRDLLIMIQKYKKEHQWPGIDNHISLFLHSLGNYYLEYAVNNSLLKNIDDELFDNLILNAAAVEQEGHVDWLSRLDIQKRIYVNSNKHDFTLNGLRLFSKAGKLLGERVKHPISENAVYVNFSDAIGFSFPTHATHTYFIGKKVDKYEEVKDYYHQLFHGKEINVENEARFYIDKKIPGYSLKLIH